jgi:hypothetical protein
MQGAKQTLSEFLPLVLQKESGVRDNALTEKTVAHILPMSLEKR